MTVFHDIVGYDCSSEHKMLSFTIPSYRMEAIRNIVNVSIDDPEVIGSYPLTLEQAAIILRMIGIPAELITNTTYFLEASSEGISNAGI